MSQRKNIQDDLTKLSLSSIEEVIEILGFIDGKGQTHLSGAVGSTRSEDIQGFLAEAPNRTQKQDMSRRVKTALQFQKAMANEVAISASKNGYFVEPPNNWKKKPSYSTLCLLYLGIMVYHEDAGMDVLDQLLEMKFPLMQLILWRRLIQLGKPISFQYKSDRRKVVDTYECLIPIRLHHREGHWRLIGWDALTEKFAFLPLHSLRNVQESEREPGKKPPKFSMEKFKKGIFGPGYDPSKPPIRAKIFVPLEYQEAVMKRRPTGTWLHSKRGTIWEVEAHYEQEIYDYVFRWNGILKILGPEKLVQGFEEKCRSFLKK